MKTEKHGGMRFLGKIMKKNDKNPTESKTKEPRIKSLRQRTVLTLLLILLPFSLASIILSLNTIRNMSSTLDTTITAALDSYTTQLAGKMGTTDYILLDTSTNNADFLDYMHGSADWHQDLSRHKLIQDMSNAVQLSSCADGMFLYHESRDELNRSSRRKLAADRSYDDLKDEEIRELLADPSMCDGKWHVAQSGSLRVLFHVLRGTEYQLGAYINCGDVLTSVQKSMGYKEAETSVGESPAECGMGRLVFRSRIPYTNSFLTYSVRRIDLYGPVLIWAFLSVVLFFLSLFLIPILTFFFMKHVDRPLKELRLAFHELEQGNREYRITDMASTSEFSYAESSFNTMAGNLTALQEQVLEDEKKQHELITHNLQLQLNNLQLQIRPHFLQNTMNLLYTLIQNGQTENAQRLVLYLSRYFRYMFRYGKDLELFDKEVEMVREYLEISALHYENMFTVSYQLDPLLSFMRVPPLLIHNFVENIIQHALIPGKTIHIILYGEYDDENRQAVLMISDDGNGIHSDYADRINENRFDDLPEGKHIGIRNSINRLKHYYGEEASVNVETADGEGTTFTIRIPCDLTDVEEME